MRCPRKARADEASLFVEAAKRTRSPAMPPRRRARGAPQDPAAALPCRILELPLPVLHAVLSLLPVDARLRCAEVCRAWRAALADRALWTALDFSGCAVLTDALLTAAAARAGGQLRSLTLRENCENDELWRRALLPVVMANANTLRELRGVEYDDTGRQYLFPVLQNAPQLRVLEADMSLSEPFAAIAFLSNQAPYGPLRMRRLTIRDRLGWPARWSNLDASTLHALTAALRGHTSLEYLHLEWLDSNVLMPLSNALDAMLMNRLVSIEFTFASNPFTVSDHPDAILALIVRLLECGTLTHLGLYRLAGFIHSDDARFSGLWAALRANTTLTSLSTSSHQPQFGDYWNYCKITPWLRALKSHASLRRLEISDTLCESPQWSRLDRDHASALGELIEADAPALREVHLLNCAFDIKPAISALARNSHLRSLRYEPMWLGDGMSDNDVRALLVPALRANRTLRELQLEANEVSMTRTMRAAVASVAQRG